MHSQRRTRWDFLATILVLAFACGLSADARADEAAEQQAQKILAATGVQGGFIVHLGAGDGKLTAALRASDSYLVHGLATDAVDVDAARGEIKKQGLYGDVSVDQLRGKRLPYTDNMVNLVVAEDAGGVSMDEIVRVLAPHGVAYVKQNGEWKKLVKPRPKNIDEWTHFLHDPGGNAVAHDDVVAPPRHLQWIGSPRWSRHHDRMASTSALVSTGGRIFYVMDEGSRTSIQLPSKWKLIARDAFNGTILWKRDIPTWHNHLWPLKSGPTQLARRLVAIDQRVYVTLGYAAPLSVLDAATGKTIRTYEGTAATEEVIVSGKQIFALVSKGQRRLTEFAPQLNLGDQGRINRTFRWNGVPREVVAVDAASGKVMWRHKSKVAPITLAADAKRVFFHDGEKVVCLDRQSGRSVWNSDPVSRRATLTFNFGPKVVVVDDVVLYAGGDRKMKALAIDTGKELWSAPHPRSATL
jgi:outer membrane protein assembly factor BamB